MGRGLNAALMIGGGLAKGIGEGILFQVKSLREQAIENARQDAENRRQTERITAEGEQRGLDRTQRSTDAGLDRTARAEDTDKQITSAEKRTKLTTESEERIRGADRAERRGLLQRTFIGADGMVHGVTAGGEEKTFGAADMPAADKAELKLATEAATVQSVDENTGRPTKNIDQDKLAGILAKSQSPTLRGMAKAYRSGDLSSLEVNAGAPSRTTVTPDGEQDNTVYSTGLELPPENLPATTADTAGNATVQQQAEQVKADYKAGRISKDEAERRLKALKPGG